ncbi:MAG: hypothetical protein IT495_18535 [Gammaproteobacteria bacterium]|nr:hypothetical protein [Gammaproteobacteria bacterium]
MADIYVRSSDGSNSDNGSTWALAKATAVGAAAIDAAGDAVWFSKTHSESTASTTTISVNGTSAAPVKLLCCDDTGNPEPPTALSTGAVIATTLDKALSVVGGHCYVYGIEFRAGSSTSNVVLALQGNPSSSQAQFYEQCKFKINSTGSSSTIRIVNSAPLASSRTQWKDCQLEFSHSGQRVLVYGNWEWVGGSLVIGTSPNYVFAAGGSGYSVTVRWDGVDLSAASSSIDIMNGQVSGATLFVARRLKLPASWSGNLLSGTVLAGVRAEMYDSDSTSTNYRVWIEDCFATLRDDTGIYLNGGAYDGTTRLSHKIVTTANCNNLSGRFYTHEFTVWNDVVSGTVDVEFEIVHDSATDLTDAEIWPEVLVRESASDTLGTWVSGGAATILTAGTDWPNSSETWTGTGGFSNPNKQTLSVTIAPRVAGPLMCRIVVAKASKTLYLHPAGVVA